MRYIYYKIVALVCFFSWYYCLSQETELAIGYIPETQDVAEPKASPQERQAIAALLKAIKTQKTNASLQESTQQPFSDPLFV